LRKVIVALLEPTIIASYLAMVKTFLNLRARVLKYVISLSIEFVVQLSIRHNSSSIGDSP
jgi:hypothetical protein